MLEPLFNKVTGVKATLWLIMHPKDGFFCHLVDLYVSHRQAFLNRCHKKRKDSLETWAASLIFSF